MAKSKPVMLLVDPEMFLEKSEILNRNVSTIINLDDDDDDDDDKNYKETVVSAENETINKTYQTEFEKVLPKSEMKLEVLKEVPHDDKENIHHSFLNEFGKRPRGRPPKDYDERKTKLPTSDDNESDKNEQPTSSSNPKLFNITLGFLGKSKKHKRKKSHNLIQQSEINSTSTDALLPKKRGRRPNKKFNSKHSPNEDAELLEPIINNNNLDASSINETTVSDINKNDSSYLNHSSSTWVSLTSPLKRKRGRPFGTKKKDDITKIKNKYNGLNKQKPGRPLGRPLLTGTIIVLPRKRPGRPPGPPKEPKLHVKPGRPKGPPKPPKVAGKRGRPKGPPKPPKSPRKRGRKASGLTKIKTKIPGRGRGRPSFKSLIEMKLLECTNGDNVVEEKPNEIITKTLNGHAVEHMDKSVIMETITIESSDTELTNSSYEHINNTNNQFNVVNNWQKDSESEISNADEENSENSDSDETKDIKSELKDDISDISVADNNFEPLIIDSDEEN